MSDNLAVEVSWPLIAAASSELCVSDPLITASLLRVRMRHPFLGVLALLARFRRSEEVVAAATDGRDVLYNPGYFEGLSQHQIDATLLHALLHAALTHRALGEGRDSARWNIAAD